MKAAYFDASAIVKLVHLEPESQALLDYLGEPVQAATSALSDVEVVRALVRLGHDEDDAMEAMRGFFIVDLHRDVRLQAGAIGEPALRSLDAIHLATALAIEDDVDFITYDDRLAAAARTQGLRVVQPGR